MMTIILSTLILGAIAAVLYRLGGYGPPFNTKYRDMGIPACVLVWLIWNGYWDWSLIPTFGLIFASQTSYFKKKGTDAKWYNWLFVGLAFSAALIIIPIFDHNWTGFLYRSAAVTIFTVLWSQFISKDWLEEGGRGLIQILTLPLLLIGRKKNGK